MPSCESEPMNKLDVENAKFAKMASNIQFSKIDCFYCFYVDSY